MPNTHQFNGVAENSSERPATGPEIMTGRDQVNGQTAKQHPGNFTQSNSNSTADVEMGGELPVPRVINVDTLADRSGNQISYEQWLSKEIPRVTKGRAYIDRETPFEYPHLDLSDAERVAFLDGLTDAIDEVYDSIDVGDTPATTSENASGKHSAEAQRRGVEKVLAERLAALGALAAQGLITAEEVSQTRLELIKEAILSRQTVS